MIDIKQQQKISQQQQLSSQQLHSLSLLSMPIFELQEKTDEIMNSNPVLEYEVLPGSSLLRELPDSSIEDERNNNSSDDENDFYDEIPENWHDDLPIPADETFFSPEQQQKRDYFFSNITESESMQQQLLQELSYLNLTETERELAEAITGAIDERGWLSTPPADIAQAANAELFEVEDMLKKLQKIFPPGIGARDLEECLRLQLEAQGENDPKIFEFLKHLDDFGNNRSERIAAAMKITTAEVNKLGDRIRKLNPFPGNSYNSGKAEFIVPELEIIQNEEGSFILKNHEELLPHVKISGEYRKMLEDTSLNSEDRNYIKQKIQEAENFVNSLLMREKTIVRIGNFIMNEQQDFFKNGISSLKPMTMAQAAEALDIHETTVSRGCANKYIVTPQGLFEFKFFFTGGFTNASGEDVSVRAIKEKIRRFIEDENPEKPLSDEKISALLADSGLKVARRTVAKYREQMNILPTNLRRRH